MPPDENGWNEWGRHVLEELKRLNSWLGAVDEKQEQQAVEIGKLKVKAGVWGALGGLVPALLAAALMLVKGCG